MTWQDILKVDKCCLNSKETFHGILTSMGAGKDLLDGVNRSTCDELREMLEEFSVSSPQKTKFKFILENWDKCIVDSERNPNGKGVILAKAKSLSPQLEPVLQLIDEPMTAREIMDLFFTWRENENRRRRAASSWETQHRVLSTRILPDNASLLARLLRRHANILEIESKPYNLYMWEPSRG